jgi:hypothetical protein
VGDHRGFWGFISTPGIFFKNDHSGYLNHQYPLKKYFQRPKKTIKTPNTPFSLSDRGRCFLALITTNILTLTSTAFNAAVSGLMGTALGIRTVSSMMHSKIANQDKVINKHKATAIKRKQLPGSSALASPAESSESRQRASLPSRLSPFLLSGWLR